jgi:hypothetical protein
VAIGAPTGDENRGWGLVYRHNGSDWTQLGGKLELSANFTDASFAVMGRCVASSLRVKTIPQGQSVSLSGDGNTVAVGAPSYYSATAQGRVRVFRYDSIVGWVQLGADFNGENNFDQMVVPSRTHCGYQ